MEIPFSPILCFPWNLSEHPALISQETLTSWILACIQLLNSQQRISTCPEITDNNPKKFLTALCQNLLQEKSSLEMPHYVQSHLRKGISWQPPHLHGNMYAQFLLNRLYKPRQNNHLEFRRTISINHCNTKKCKLGNTVSLKCLLNTHCQLHPQYYSDTIIFTIAVPLKQVNRCLTKEINESKYKCSWNRSFKWNISSELAQRVLLDCFGLEVNLLLGKI